MNPLLNRLQPYPFERLRHLLEETPVRSDQPAIALSMGEPRHQPPERVLHVMHQSMHGLSLYPATAGLPTLREAIANWLTWRFLRTADHINPDRHIIPVNGSREALFASVQCLAQPATRPLILMPNPFYQIYEGAALLAGAQPYYLPCSAHHHLPDYDAVPESIWKQTQILFVCSPANPSGAVTPLSTLQKLIEKSQKYQFFLFSDECYSEIYPQDDAPPPGLLQAAADMGLTDFSNMLVFHSLSKRSSLPGLRSGFVAGDARLIQPFLLYRTYHGSAMPIPTQMASIAAWNDESHVRTNRALYQQKFAELVPMLRTHCTAVEPDASFYLWLRTPIPDTEFCAQLWQQHHVQILPGSFLARECNGVNPGAGYVRIALVPDLDTCREACDRIICFLQSL